MICSRTLQDKTRVYCAVSATAADAVELSQPLGGAGILKNVVERCATHQLTDRLGDRHTRSFSVVHF